MGTSKEFVTCIWCPGEVSGTRSALGGPESNIVHCDQGWLEGSCRLQLGNLPQYRSATDNKLMEEQNCCSQGGRGETRPALTQFPARDGATGGDIRALLFLH